MPMYEDGQYNKVVIGDNHPVKIMDGNDVIVQAKPLELTGTSLAFENTYNDTVQGLTVYGKSEQITGVKGTNLIANGNFNNGTAGWNSSVGQCIASTEEYISAPYALKCIATGDGAFVNQSCAHIVGHKEYVSFSYYVDTYTAGSVFAQSGNSFKLISSPAVRAWTNVSFIGTQTAGGGLNFNFVGLLSGTAVVYIDNFIYVDLTATFGAGNEPTAAQIDTMLAQYPNSWTANSPSPDYPSTVTPVTGNLNITDGTNIKQTLALADLNGIAGVYDTLEPRVLADGVWRSRKTQRIGVKVFDGTESPAVFPTSNDLSDAWYYFNSATLGVYGAHKFIYSGICSHFAKISSVYDASLTANKFCLAPTSDPPYIGFRITRDITNIISSDNYAAKAAKIEDWLAAQYAAGTPVTVYYVLVTPIVTLGDPVTLPTYPGYTHIDAGGAELVATCRVVDI